MNFRLKSAYRGQVKLNDKEKSRRSISFHPSDPSPLFAVVCDGLDDRFRFESLVYWTSQVHELRLTYYLKVDLTKFWLLTTWIIEQS